MSYFSGNKSSFNTNNTTALGNTANSFNNVKNYHTFVDPQVPILTWLSPLEPRLRHQGIRERRVENIGEWLLQTEEFKSWEEVGGEGGSGNAVLFCYGDPGVGKTYISSLVIDRLCDHARGRNTTVACLYFDFAVQREQSSTSMLRALLKQLVGGLEEVPEEISRAYEDQKKAVGGREPGPSDVVKMLQTTSSEKRTFICIDALDECVARDRVKLLDSLNRILQNSPGTRIFVTGRPHIQPEIAGHLSGRATSISITPRRGDIISYLHTRLGEDTTPDAMNSSLRADILSKIPQDISEIFLLVSLNIDAILQETTIRRRRQRLSEMADGLGSRDAYVTTLGRIRAQDGERSRLGIAALMWISHSERHLKADELCQALGVEIGSSSLDSDNVPSIGTLLACCQGLVAVDKDASTIRLIHYTLQDYLRAHPELSGTAHTTMAETCLSYLNSQQARARSTSSSHHLQDMPFLEYSSLYWGVHARRGLSNCAKSLALKLFDDFNSHISTKILLKARYICLVDFDKSSWFSGLHCASFFGIVEIVASLIEVEGCDINQTDCAGNTPLALAASNGHEGVAKILLGRDEVNPDKPDNYRRTPLNWAATNGHEEVVKMLMDRDDVNPDKPDHGGRTPLNWAARCGHEGVVKILLGRGEVNPDKPDNCHRTPLNWAATNGHEGVVKALMDRVNVNPDKPDHGGRTPLNWAARFGHGGVIKILLGRDIVNPDQPDNAGRTPLSWATWCGHWEVVKILLGRDDVNPDKPDDNGGTPLSWAAFGGHKGVVKILLEREDVDPDKPDKYGITPLALAARRGHGGAMEILLQREDVNPEKPDNYGRTPLSQAARSGHEGVVNILLRQGDVSHDKPEKHGQTPLSGAATNGHEGVVRVLLRRGDLNPDKPDNDGQTPLQLAVRRGHAGVIALLQHLASPTPNTA